MSEMQGIAEALIRGDRENVVRLVQEALDDSVAPATILSDGLIAGMRAVGEKMKANEFYVPEVLIAARAMSNPKEADTRPGALEVLDPHLAAAGLKPAGTVVLGTVKGDLHDIGKNLVAMLIKGAGFQVIDLGIDITAEKFVEAAKEHDADVVGCSALLTTTMPQMRNVVVGIREAGLTTKVMIGGAPLTQGYADEIKADGYAPDASSAVDLVKSFVAERAAECAQA